MPGLGRQRQQRAGEYGIAGGSLFGSYASAGAHCHSIVAPAPVRSFRKSPAFRPLPSRLRCIQSTPSEHGRPIQFPFAPWKRFHPLDRSRHRRFRNPPAGAGAAGAPEAPRPCVHALAGPRALARPAAATAGSRHHALARSRAVAGTPPPPAREWNHRLAGSRPLATPPAQPPVRSPHPLAQPGTLARTSFPDSAAHTGRF